MCVCARVAFDCVFACLVARLSLSLRLLASLVCRFGCWRIFGRSDCFLFVRLVSRLLLPRVFVSRGMGKTFCAMFDELGATLRHAQSV